MLHSVIRASTGRPAMAGPPYSTALAGRTRRTPTARMKASTASLASTPRQPAREGDEHALLPHLPDALGGEHHLALAGADAEGERTQRPVRAGMRVAAHQGGARQGEAQLRADDVDDAVPAVRHRDVGDRERLRIVLEPAQLARGEPVRHRPPATWWAQRGRRRPDALAAAGTPGLRRGRRTLRAAHLLHEMAIDIKQRAAIRIGLDDMFVRDLAQ